MSNLTVGKVEQLITYPITTTIAEINYTHQENEELKQKIKDQEGYIKELESKIRKLENILYDDDLK